jgi:hypothetical protein
MTSENHIYYVEWCSASFALLRSPMRIFAESVYCESVHVEPALARMK